MDEQDRREYPPILACGEPLRLGMTLYLMTEDGLREIPTSEETHEVELVEVQGFAKPIWLIGRKGSGGSSETVRFASTPEMACSYKIDESFRKLSAAQADCRREVENYTANLAEFLKSREGT